MKKLVLVLGLTCISQLVEAQNNKGPAIKQATVERIIRTLAADDMAGRASGQPGGLQAAKFLAEGARCLFAQSSQFDQSTRRNAGWRCSYRSSWLSVMFCAAV